ncbi:MAG: hypothetical protein KME26_29100 [Oscillatoria princeps RMCB-10]|jgi:hypothetical protein|nr:hypothetical protein [Oscillatoria princeps RMCB-10]
MSGSPKFSEAEIAAWKQKILQAERQRRAEAEARRRQEAEAQERQRQLEVFRHQTGMRLQALLSGLHAAWANLYRQDAATLQYRANSQVAPVAQAQSEAQLLEISQELDKIELALQEAMQGKRRDEAEKKRLGDIERQQLELEELEQRAAETPDAEALKLDAAGRQQVRTVLHRVRSALALGDPAAVRRPLAEATALVHQHIRQIAQARGAGRHLQEGANRQLAELQVILAGLKADPAVMRWQSAAVAELEALANAAGQAIREGRPQQAVSSLSQIRQRSQTIVETANTAQLQADRRDYIADSIAQTLQDMGFRITFHQPEHPGHPASAAILGATTGTGIGISVSVPIAGQVFYDVDGFVKHSVATVEGNTAVVCDEAEQVLTQMHATLEDKFGVQMGEVLWQGKDPNRALRQAEQLPSGQRSRTRSV